MVGKVLGGFCALPPELLIVVTSETLFGAVDDDVVEDFAVEVEDAIDVKVDVVEVHDTTVINSEHGH